MIFNTSVHGGNLDEIPGLVRFFLNHSDVVYTPRVAPGATVTFEHESSFGSVDRPFDVACSGP